MRSRHRLLRSLLLSAMLIGAIAIATTAGAQDIALSGRVTDSTEGVLPGVTITATHIDSGNVFVATSEATGEYRIGALRPGSYRITAELAGFATALVEGVALQVGQRVVRDFSMRLSSVNETVTVTGDAPLVDVTQSQLGGNVDTRQMESLPLNGRNWMQLVQLAPGTRTNAVEDNPIGTLAGAFQLNVDGQQVSGTQTYSASAGQPRFSRDAIGEFELISSRFDASQGRSLGLQVNAVTKAGTNTFRGTAAAYFRDDKLNAEDPIVNRTPEYSNQQFATTFGGPLRQDRVHFFGYYEGEREPQAIVFTGPYPPFNISDFSVTRTQNLAGGRVDVQVNDKTRLMGRVNSYINDEPVQNIRLLSGTNHPSTLTKSHLETLQAFGSLTRVLGGTSTLELKGGLSSVHRDLDGIIPPSPTVQLRGYTIGRPSFSPLLEYQDTYSMRGDYSTIAASHEIKLGGEWLFPINRLYWANLKDGVIVADLGPPPANLTDLFPVWNDPSTWNLAALSPITRQVRQSVGDFEVHCASDPESCRRKKPQYGLWLQDNWRITSKLTLNLGLRWDFALDGLANEIELPPIRTPQPQQWRDFGPRVGFAYALTPRTVLRGGWGKHFAGAVDHNQHFLLNFVAASPELLNDGRPNFASDPFNLAGGGRIPTVEEVRASRREILSQPLLPDAETPFAYQTSVGFQQQLADTLGVQADYVWIAGRHEEFSFGNLNLGFDPLTAINYPFRNIATRPYPEYGRIGARGTVGTSEYHALETAVNKRFGQNWQASVTYTLSKSETCDPLHPMAPPGVTGPIDLGGECSLGGSGSYGAPDQRHRAVFNGIWEAPYQLQLSGMYFYGSGQRFQTNYTGDLRDTGGFSSRLRPDGTIVPRNDFQGDPVRRVDLRVQRVFQLWGRTTVAGIFEVFNLFNHDNYGLYTTDQASPAYGRPNRTTTVEYQPRMMQLGFRFEF